MDMTPIQLALTSDQARSVAFSSQRLVNCYAELGRPGTKSPFVLYGTPGLRPWGEAGSSPSRGEINMGGVLYVVAGTALYSVDSAGTATSIGGVSGSGRVVMAQNGVQLAIAAPDVSAGYVYNVNTAVFGQITDGDFFGATGVAYLKGFFLWSSGTGQFQYSAVDDATDYDALDFATAEFQGDENLLPVTVGSQAWMMGTATIEPWYPSGNVDLVFEPTQDVVLKGLASRFGPAILDNTLFWPGLDPEAGGGAQVYRANGYVPEVISTPAIEKILEGVTALDAVRGFAYKQNGHLFYGLILPDDNAVFFDVVTQLWHERATYGLSRWLGNGHCYVYGKHIVPSASDGQLYELDLDYFFDDEDMPLVMEATLPQIGDDSEKAILASVVLDMEKGVGLTSGQGSDPQVTLQMSDDQGATWSNSLTRSMGAIGERRVRVRWNRLGQFYTRILRFRISDPVKRALIACWGSHG